MPSPSVTTGSRPRPLVRRRPFCRTVGLAGGAFTVALLGAGGVAHAQSPAIQQAQPPDLLVLLDTSKLMGDAMDGSSLRATTCTAAGKKTRWAALAEVLTGRINGLECGRIRAGASGAPEIWVPLSSNTCVPLVRQHPNVLSGVSSDPRSWPNSNGSPHVHMNGSIAFQDNYSCGSSYTTGPCNPPNNSGVNDFCRFQPGQWDQVQDGLIDSYNTQIRFGLATVDGLRVEFPPDCSSTPLPGSNSFTHEAGGRGGGPGGTGAGDGYVNTYPPRYPGWNSGGWGSISGAGLQLWRQWQLDIWGRSPPASTAPYWWTSAQYPNSVFPRQFSYWYQSSGANWHNGTRDYASPPAPAPAGTTIQPLCVPAPEVPCTTDADCAGAGACASDPGSCFCSSARNPANPAQHVCMRRMPPIPDTADIGIRNSEAPPWMGRLIGFGSPTDNNAERREHNDMVQQAILVQGPYESSAPLGAMLRDAYEFLVRDNVSRGPARQGSTPTTLLSPFNDSLSLLNPSATDACRQAHIVIVSQGEPSQDLSEGPGYWATELKARDILTFAVGVGQSEVTRGTATPYENVDCADLTELDLEPDGVCEWNTTRSLWRFADVEPGDRTPLERTALRQCCTLLEIAVAGGTERPYFAKNQAELKGSVGQLLGLVAGGTLSRTVPIFSPVSSAFLAQNSPTNPASSVFFELRSSMQVPDGGGLWQGNLERVRYLCDGTDAVPVRQTIAPSRGDVFDANLRTNAPTRRFFTVAPSSASRFDRTLRPANPGAWCSDCPSNPNTEDGLAGEYYSRLTGTNDDSPEPIEAFITGLNSVVPVADVLGISTAATAANGDCDNAVHNGPAGGTVPNRETCARRALRWWAGVSPNYCDSAQSPCRTRPRGGTSGSPLGAIYRSNPIILQPPSPDVADQTYSSERSETAANESFVARHSGRPTMLFSQTVDGQLHAFSLAKNFFGTPDPLGYDSGISDGGALENNELWSFVPPIVLPSLWTNFNTHARLLDGPMTAANVVYRRSLADLADGVANWSSVVVGSGGFAQLGAYYYAVDVTNPLRPRFLWQMTRAGADPLFGDFSAGPAIAHIAVNDSGQVRVIAVAILPGGSPSSTPTGTRLRKNTAGWTGTDYTPRTRVRDWSLAEPARSLTFVELATGRVIARLHGRPDDTTGLAPGLVREVDFDSPITSTPAVFPVATGEPARQVYVGDADGTVWRVNVTNPNPMLWDARIAWDAYNFSDSQNAYDRSWVAHGPSRHSRPSSVAGITKPTTQTQAATRGQPIQHAPMISLDDRGVPVISFSTGDQDSFQTASSGMVNFVVSFTDEPNAAGTGWSPRVSNGPGASAETNRGVMLAFVHGARATGPLSLYDGQLIFSYFDPTTTSGCAAGRGGTCALDNLRRRNTENPPRPIPFLNQDRGEPPTEPVDALPNDDDICYTRPNEFVFGVAINRVPTCAGLDASFNDPWLSGSYTSQTSSSAAGYQLVMHTGEGGSPEDGGVTNTTRMNLPVPRSVARVNSWVSALQ